MPKRALFLCLVIVVAGAAVWAGFRFGALQWLRPQAKSNSQASKNIDAWAEAVEKVKEHRGDPAGWQAVAEIPPELKHYSDRRWFLATQVAEVGKHNVQTSQDFVDLAAMIQRHDMVAVPAVSDTYVLYGVGEEADDKPFSRSHDNQSVDLYDEAQLSNAYKRLDEKRSALQTEIKTLKLQASELKKRDREKQKELQKQITAQQQELSSTND
ncbi:MAG TPA: hypothetical protein VGW36_04485 [Pyrinomonadaceae bacterium]|nr:hypothetical protein [Pyrinomonadaceae bacterium]